MPYLTLGIHCENDDAGAMTRRVMHGAYFEWYEDREDAERVLKERHYLKEGEEFELTPCGNFGGGWIFFYPSTSREYLHDVILLHGARIDDLPHFKIEAPGTHPGGDMFRVTPQFDVSLPSIKDFKQ